MPSDSLARPPLAPSLVLYFASFFIDASRHPHTPKKPGWADPPSPFPHGSSYHEVGAFSSLSPFLPRVVSYFSVWRSFMCNFGPEEKLHCGLIIPPLSRNHALCFHFRGLQIPILPARSPAALWSLSNRPSSSPYQEGTSGLCALRAGQSSFHHRVAPC